MTGLIKAREYGVTATIREQASGDLRVFVQYGRQAEALQALAEEIDRRPGCWRIVSLSNPSSIARDLQGARVGRIEKGRPARLDWNPLEFETLLLSKIGRLDLLQPIPARVTADSRQLPYGRTLEEHHDGD